MTKPGGLIQFQPFVPVDGAARVYRTLIETCQAEGLTPYLGVLKRPMDIEASLEHFETSVSAVDIPLGQASRSVTLVLGLEEVHGTAWFDDIKITDRAGVDGRGRRDRRQRRQGSRLSRLRE